MPQNVIHVRYGKTLRYYTTGIGVPLVETLGAPYFLAGWSINTVQRAERTLAGRSLALAGWGWCGDLDDFYWVPYISLN